MYKNGSESVSLARLSLRYHGSSREMLRGINRILENDVFSFMHFQILCYSENDQSTVFTRHNNGRAVTKFNNLYYENK